VFSVFPIEKQTTEAPSLASNMIRNSLRMEIKKSFFSETYAFRFRGTLRFVLVTWLSFCLFHRFQANQR